MKKNKEFVFSKFLKTPIEKPVKTSQKRAQIPRTRFYALFFFLMEGDLLIIIIICFSFTEKRER